jgi:hypothetical protein
MNAQQLRQTPARTVTVQIVGAPVACSDGARDAWREVARWAAVQLTGRYGEAVSVSYFDLFDPTCPHLPADAQLPLVLVDGQVFSSGGKISVPALRARLEALGLAAGKDGR